MPRAPTKLTSNGRVTIPAPVRQELDLSPGDYVIVDVEPLPERDQQQ
jgi:AbrB family looped-hinge helix DNA binding protein